MFLGKDPSPYITLLESVFGFLFMLIMIIAALLERISQEDGSVSFRTSPRQHSLEGPDAAYSSF